MAYLRRIKNTWQIQYYLDGKKCYKQLSSSTPKSIVLAEKKRIEAELALHKAGVKRFIDGNKVRIDHITIREMTDKLFETRKNEVSESSVKRNLLAMRVFMEIIGADMPLIELKTEHFDQFKKLRFEHSIKRYEENEWELDKDKIKRGVNKDLVNIRLVIRAAAAKGIIPESYVPKISFFKVDRNRLPKYLNDQEIIAIANQLDGEARLAFWIVRYSGARRSEIARHSLSDDRGLRWKHIDWMRNKIRLYSKKQERLVPLHPALRKLLLDRKAELATDWKPEDHIIHYIRDTLTTNFRTAMKNAGIDKPGIGPHLTAYSRNQVSDIHKGSQNCKEYLGHKNISTTEIYMHIIENEVDKAVNEAFN